ncbi:MAG: hypothetical protein PHY79_22100 [Anaerolineae bacterium]|nr:hypothetical protein [Anaerolineae bacterium]
MLRGKFLTPGAYACGRARTQAAAPGRDAPEDANAHRGRGAAGDEGGEAD